MFLRDLFLNFYKVLFEMSPFRQKAHTNNSDKPQQEHEWELNEVHIEW